MERSNCTRNPTVDFQTAGILRLFIDENGRTERLLFELSLVYDGFCRFPILCIYIFINRNRSKNYMLLAEFVEREAWMVWLLFILGGLVEQGQLTTVTLH